MNNRFINIEREADFSFRVGNKTKLDERKTAVGKALVYRLSFTGRLFQS